MYRIRQSSLFGALSFLASFAFLRFLLETSVGFAGSWMGFSEAEIGFVVADNELIFQAFCLLGALLLVLFYRGGTELLKERFKVPLRWKLEQWSAVFSISWNFALKAFLVTSTGVALSLFLGFSTIEAPKWELLGFSDLFPLKFFTQVFSLLAWILGLEGARNLLWSELRINETEDEGFFSSALQKRFLIVLFEAVLYFAIFNATAFVGDQLFVGLVCVLIASANFLWFEHHQGRLNPLVSSAQRVGAMAGVGISLFHIYGQPLGGARRSSLLHLFSGNLLEPTGNLALHGAVGQVLFILFLVYFTNRLIHNAVDNASP